jgi:hypothetical protein
MDWIDNKAGEPKPINSNRPVLCYCPKWCESEYQVAYFINGLWCYEGQPNDGFNDLVEQWTLFMCAD